jgi:hypothetical protein
MSESQTDVRATGPAAGARSPTRLAFIKGFV